MAGYLTTHVLDTARGCPAAGLRIELYKIVSNSRKFLSEALTNDDGRTNEQILNSAGCYQIEALGPNIIENIKGDFFNVMGFPLFPFLFFLKNYKIGNNKK